MLKNNLFVRSLTGFFYVAAVVGAILLSPVTSALLFLVIAVLAMLEFLKAFKGQARPDMFFSVMTGVLIYLIISLVVFHVLSPTYLSLSLIPVVSIFIYELYRNEKNPFLNIGITLIASVYVVLPLSLLNSIYAFGMLIEGPSHQFILAFFILNWVNDSMAYLIGKWLGRTKLFPRVSPQKTWEGFAGGLLFTWLAAWLLSLCYTGIDLNFWFLFASIIVIFATLGDLVESLLKRDFNLKDTGSILPGHGGMLDRFDGVLLSSLMIFLFLNFFIGNG